MTARRRRAVMFFSSRDLCIRREIFPLILAQADYEAFADFNLLKKCHLNPWKSVEICATHFHLFPHSQDFIYHQSQ